MKIKKLSLHLAINFLLYATIFLTVSTSYAWFIGQNRLVNTDFENDEVGQPPMEWALEKGG